KLQTSQMQLIPRAAYIDRDGTEVRVKPLETHNGQLQVQLQEGTDKNKILTVAPDSVHDRIHFHTANYPDAFEWFPFGKYLTTTLTICLISVIGTVLSCSLVAYGLACIEWRGREVLFWFMLSTMMLPQWVTMIPVFLMFKSLGWINTILPLVVPTFLGNAF